MDSGKGKKIGQVVKNEQRHRAKCDRLATVAAADLRLPGERETRRPQCAARAGAASLWPALWRARNRDGAQMKDSGGFNRVGPPRLSEKASQDFAPSLERP